MSSRIWLPAAFLVFAVLIVALFPRGSSPPESPGVHSVKVPTGSVTVAPSSPPRPPSPGRSLPPRPQVVHARLKPLQLLRVQGQYDEAIRQLEELVARGERDVLPESLYELARLYMVKKNFRAAKEMLERYLREFPGDRNRGNAERALEYMRGYEKYRGEYVSFEEDIR